MHFIVDVDVIGFNKNTGRFPLSHRKLWGDEEVRFLYNKSTKGILYAYGRF